MIVEWNAKKCTKYTTSWVKWPKSSNVLEIQKKGMVTNTFSRKLHKTTKKLNLDNFETPTRFLAP